MSRTTRMADCHPERKHYCKGLCERCYNKQPHVRERKAKNRRRRYHQNVDASRAELRERRKRFTPTQRYAWCIKHRYGLSPQDVEQMKQVQNNRCAICEEEFVNTPHIDHSHVYGNVRGLLCAKCNQGLGYIEKAGWLKKAQVYLERTAPMGVRSMAA